MRSTSPRQRRIRGGAWARSGWDAERRAENCCASRTSMVSRPNALPRSLPARVATDLRHAKSAVSSCQRCPRGRHHGWLDDIASRQCSFALPPLKVTRLDDFLALTPARPCRHIDRTAQRCVTRFDRFRAPLTASERARRSLAPLTLRERMFLDQWGYPYVLDRFRFHFSLSGSLAQVNEEVRARLARAAVQTFTAPPLAPLIFDAICIFEEPSPGAAFRLIHRSRFAHQGRLVYVVGPSGAGKDSVINWARERLVSDTQVVFTQRTITRPGTGMSNRITR